MATALTTETVLKLTSWCVIREQEEQYLIYNSQTDELHLLPLTGFYAYQLCNGWSTVGEIEQSLSMAMQVDSRILRPQLQKFFSNLVARGILEVEW
ncbi:hypothetical protein [Candidatus Methylomirabilis sp.]|uniref:hypothetical protein n=1 Tax=Candidatus Methylomirabilis sp. TaxID=2032687 RepID=UPI002A620610|nr:hypothetical protein [Candidatus Methylomirabilis sp.]